MAYLHGVEVIELTTGARGIQTATSSVIGIVGLSDTADSETLIAVNSDSDLAQFGDAVPGNTIAQALKAIFQQGGAKCLVINVFDAGSHYTAVADEAVTAVGDDYKGANPFYDSIVVKDATATTTYVLDTDYTVDNYIVTRIEGGAISDGDALKISYNYLDPGLNAAVTSVIGAGGAPRTGIELFDESLSTFGYTPKILIAPYFSEVKTVADALVAKSEELKSVCILDNSAGVAIATAVTHRGDATKSFGINSDRAILAYPRVKTVLDWSGETTVPYSSFLAGVIAKVDNNPAKGYWKPPSNEAILSITGLETPISFNPSQTGTDSNTLNAAGICTIVSGFGTGYLAWGQRNASYPTSTTPDNFINVRRVADILHLSVENSTLQFIGEPINNAVIDAIRETVNGFIRTLIQRGALIDGSKCEFRSGDNPPAQIAAGQLVFYLNIMPPPGLERLTFNSYIDINLLNNLLA